MTREEAINEIKSWAIPSEKGREVLETLIPELKEGEDEKIRKDIYTYIYNELHNIQQLTPRTNEIERWLSWLEKQKVKVYDDTPYYTPEEVNAKIEKPIDVIPKIPRQEYLYHLLANGVITFSDYEFLMRNKGRKPADLSEMMVHKEPYIAPVPTPMTADEQKPEWGEEDEKIAKEIEEELWYPGDFPDYPSKEESELYDDCQRRLDWFKNKLKSLRPQPKKNDMITPNKEFFQWIYNRLVDVHNENPNVDYMISFKKRIEEMSFDKSHWKPSEVQMSMLLAVINEPRNAGAESCQLALGDLYQDLKKLM